MIFKEIRNRITYRIERFLLGGAGNQLLFIAFIILLVSLAAGLAVYLLYPGVGTFKDTVWWAFLRLSDPGYLGDDQGILRRFVSTIVTILGYVLFMGSLVAIMTQWLNGTIRKLEMGLTPITLKGHVVILGWTNRTAIIVKEFMLSEERLNRFLRTIRKTKLRIVILNEEVNSSIVQELKDELGALWDPGRIILRSGSPLRIDHIRRVDILNAGIVILPGASFAYGGAENMDTRSIKAIMSIYQYSRQEDVPSPDIVTEILDAKKMPVIRSLYHGNVEVVASNIIISKIMTQNIRHHGLAVVYDELLSNAGNEIYVKDASVFSGKSFASLEPFFPYAVLIGIIKNSTNSVVLLNPDPHTLLDEQDKLVMIAEDYKRTEPQLFDGDFILPEESVISKAGESKGAASRLLIVGWSQKIPVLLKELLGEKSNIVEIDNLSVLDKGERKNLLARHNLLSAGVPIRFFTGNSTHHEDIEQLDLELYSEVLMLANDWMESGEEADARTIMGYVMLKKEMASFSSTPSFIVELMDPDNHSLVADDDDVIVTPLLISYSLAQISLNRDLRIVYDELFTTGGTEIFLVPIEYYQLKSGEEITFEYISRRVKSYSEISIGLCIFSDNGRKDIFLNPQQQSRWQLEEGDRIIVLSNEA